MFRSYENMKSKLFLLVLCTLAMAACKTVGGPIDPGTPYVFAPLDAPPAGEGFQIYLPPFKIAPADEREIFQYKSSGQTERVYIDSLHIRMREGSHHIILYTLNGDVEGLADGEIREHSESE